MAKSQRLSQPNGNLFYLSIVHKILTRTAYAGVYNYNTHDSRTRRAQSKDEWVAVQVPQIVLPSPSNEYRGFCTPVAPR